MYYLMNLNVSALLMLNYHLVHVILITHLGPK